MDLRGSSIYQSNAFPIRIFGNAFAYTSGLLDVMAMCAMNPFRCLSGSPFPSKRLNCGSLNPLGNAMLSNRSVKDIFIMVADGVDPTGMTETIIFFKSFNCCCKVATAGST
ncbi:hypothetical protein LIER_41559 [Lithospermum erythrorhizon]|uniref:Uncharacterized protein n=1 Tax=Lithospermum erythrorhizon TaxID=34254 RepID=A0AAV3RB66_LITER